MRDDELVTLATYRTVPEAAITLNVLEANGIKAFLANATTATMAPHLSMPFEVRLQIAARDIGKAQELLSTLKAETNAQ
ncbi:MAG TPA: hypothetical protein VGM76_15320 [Lacipirellulaceae bacterium]